MVVLEGLPVLQCEGCNERLIEDAVMVRVDELVTGVRESSEQEIVSFSW